MHTYVCHNRKFKTIRGLKQHILYVEKTLTIQSEACDEIIGLPLKEETCEQPKANILTPLESTENASLTDDLENVFCTNVNTECDNILPEESEGDFNEYVLHHLSSLTNFTREMYVEIDNLKTNKNTGNQELINELLSEIETLKNDCKTKDEIIRNIRTSDNYAFDDVTKTPFRDVSRGVRKHEARDSTCVYPKLSNRFGPLRYINNDTNETCTTACSYTGSNVKPYDNEIKSAQTQDKIPNKRPLICMTEKHLQKFKPIRPGPSSWASSTKSGKRITILSDSMLQRIQRRELNAQIDNGYATFKCYPGARPNEMNWAAIPHLIEETTHVILVQSGTNQLRRYDGQIISSTQIADEVIDIGLTSRDLGVKQIVISGIITRNAGMEVEKRRKEVNSLLSILCKKHDFIYLENDNISLDDICDDRLHLKPSGSKLAALNILNILNSR